MSKHVTLCEAAFVTLWHACSSLCYQSDKDLEVTMEAAREACITVVSLPLVNQWTQVSSKAHHLLVPDPWPEALGQSSAPGVLS